MNYLSEIFILHFIPYTYESKNDKRAFISNKTLSNPNGPTIWHFGGSSLAAALDSDIKLNTRVEGKLSFVNLASSAQTHIESLAILRKVNLKRGDVVIIHTSLVRLNRVFLPSKRTCTPGNLLMFYKDFVAIHNEFGLSQDDVPITCYFTLFTRQSIINTIFKNLTKRNSFAYGVEGYDQKGQEIRRQQKKAPKKTLSIKDMSRNKNFRKVKLIFNQEAATLLPKIIHKMNVYVRSMGARLVLLDLPHNSEWYDYYFQNSELKSSLKKYDQVLKNLSENEGIPYFSFRDLADFKFDDFSDHTHLIQVGRDKFYPMYMKMILPFFQDLEIEKQL